MQDSFDIFKFTYVKKDEGIQVKLAKIIWARTEETAQKIIDIDPDEWFLLKKEATKTNRPPLELEQEQLEVARYNRMKRQELTKRIVSETLKKLGKKKEQPIEGRKNGRNV